MQVWTNGDEFVIAESAEDARAVFSAATGDTDPETLDGENGEWTRLPDDHVLRINLDDGNGITAKTCAAWADQGRGVLCSMDY
jgi:hypothetical protein